MTKLSCLLLVLTVGAGMAKAGKLVYAVSLQTKDNFICPGGGGQCPDGSTCCRGTSGQWACCPHSQAVCCSDQLHCCPQGLTCDVTGGQCVRVSANKTTSWARKITAEVRSVEGPASPENAICPDGRPCPGSCCKNFLGTYSCCFFPVAKCCSEGCCPGEFYGRRPTYPRSSVAEVDWSLTDQDAN